MSEVYTFKIIPQHERYYSDDTNWGIYTFTTDDDIPELIQYAENPFTNNLSKGSTIVGKMQRLFVGSEYEVTATCGYNEKYRAFQYTPISIVANVPKTAQHQELFLKSLVTERQAKILLSAYPNIIDDVLTGKIDKIDFALTKGIQEFTWSNIKEKILENYVISDIITLLQPLGVTFAMIKKLLSQEPNPELLKAKLLDNPYIMTKINGLGFKRVDDLALKLNPSLKVSDKRTVAFLNYYLISTGEQNGHTWVTSDILNSAVRDNINECYEVYRKILASNNFLYQEDCKIGLLYYRKIEENIYSILNELQGYESKKISDLSGIKISETEQGFQYTEEQIDVIKKSLNDNVVIISGKAGVGKTSISRALLKVFSNNNLSIACCALSAKAAQRIVEATGLSATTIHRMLGAESLHEFTFNKDNPLPADVIFVDECSMINAQLFYDLLVAINPGTRVILCGDNMQLPPIGYGNIFSDLLQKTELFNVNKLTKVLRQAEMSGILSDANKIREGINPVKSLELRIVSGELKDMIYMFRENRESLNNIAIKTFIKSLDDGESLDDIVIITPRKQDCINCTREINVKIQNILIGNDVGKVDKGYIIFKVGAKVIQRENNKEKNVYNGEIGYIENIWIDVKHKNKEMCDIRYKDYQGDCDKIITYTKEELDQIDLAYAITTHLSQGSGYNTVIGIIDNTHYMLLDNCMLYTLLTRAKKRALLLAEPSAFTQCIRTNHNMSRQTWLKDFK